MELLKINGFQLKSQYFQSPPRHACNATGEYNVYSNEYVHFLLAKSMHSICNYCSNLWACIRVQTLCQQGNWIQIVKVRRHPSNDALHLRISPIKMSSFGWRIYYPNHTNWCRYIWQSRPNVNVCCFFFV